MCSAIAPRRQHVALGSSGSLCAVPTSPLCPAEGPIGHLWTLQLTVPEPKKRSPCTAWDPVIVTALRVSGPHDGTGSDRCSWAAGSVILCQQRAGRRRLLRLVLSRRSKRRAAAANGGGVRSRGHRAISLAVAATSRAPAPISHASVARAPSYLRPGIVTLCCLLPTLEATQRSDSGPRATPLPEAWKLASLKHQVPLLDHL